MNKFYSNLHFFPFCASLEVKQRIEADKKRVPPTPATFSQSKYVLGLSLLNCVDVIVAKVRPVPDLGMRLTVNYLAGDNYCQLSK